LANGYKNWTFGTSLEPSTRLGILAAFLLPVQRATLDRQYRHLPNRPERGRVLDIGFGDAGFLENARAAGWAVVGTDLDPAVVRSARARGFDARLGTVDEAHGPFDVITMSHVIEHLHDPVGVLHSCYELLSPGGMLWLETPNIDAVGRRKFRRHWRGLEPPRHLVLFNRASLKQALRDAGFSYIRDLRQPSPLYGMYGMSRSLRDSNNHRPLTGLPPLLWIEMTAVRCLEWLAKSRREFLLIAARKPI
jgi:SAM-dependent methyltransferase